ncbi:facilitated trehalose transporter Tret1-2 homolog [Venturia canescens]|uniref:facilitated trehalose transporter Tret1-2 homolog n=1 Tax=Venturia canescens TaxID=32260 RepID=UPI001C9CE650|nr:facilitated trehalose transporter Tret1-2 homolog [Venturia canescens]XP_043268764.1 facilitated trehalose transporter Tret1-2 homolog [Venturia canescens]
MAPGSCEEGEAMLGYSTNMVKADQMKAALAYIEENNNNNNDKCNNNDKYESSVKTKEPIMGRNNSVISTQYSSNFKGVFAQCMVAGAVLTLTAGGGMPIGYSAVLLPQLAEKNGTLRINREMGSWIASVHSLASPIGALLSGPLLDAIGRRGCLILASVPLSLGWIVIGFAKNISWILVGRVVSGFAVGLTAVPAQVLVGEMADPGLRGFLVGGSFAAYSCGILLVYALGATLSWETVAFCGTILPGFALVALCLVSESPAWLVRQKKIHSARKALLWLRGGDTKQVNTEISILEVRAKEDLARLSMSTSFRQTLSSAFDKVVQPGVLKPLVIINIFNLLQILSGTYVIVFYGVDLVRDIGGGDIDNYVAAVLTALVRFLFCIVSCVLLLRMGRRTLGILSATGTALASLVLAGYTLARKDNESYIDSYVIGVCILMYVSANTIGLLTLPGLIMGELLPQRARGIGGGCTFFVFNLSLFGVTKVFPMINELVGMTGIFTIFGASALLEAVFIYVALPETKDRTLQEIEDYFQEGNVLWVMRTREPKGNESLTGNSA